MIASRKMLKSQKSVKERYIHESHIKDFGVLHREIKNILLQQTREYKFYSYGHGLLYQGLDFLSIYGHRPTEQRFNEYKISDYLKSGDRLLDIGSNAGFMAILASYRCGCEITCIEINPYMNKVCNLVATYLKLNELLTIETCDFGSYESEKSFTKIFSFATHWTDDGRYRISLADHFEKLSKLLEEDGIIFFETHTGEPGQKDFEEEIQKLAGNFSILDRFPVQGGFRHMIILKKAIA